MKASLRAAAAALLLLPAAAFAQSANTALPANPTTRQFVDAAANTNMFEIAAAQLAEQKTQNKAYQNYAQTIVADHTRMGAELKTKLADIGGVNAPSNMDESHQRMLQQLKAASGAKFEQQYRAGQIAGHQQAITLFQNYGRSGQDASLKGWAHDSVATLEKHLRDAERLQPQTVDQAKGAQSGSD